MTIKLAESISIVHEAVRQMIEDLTGEKVVFKNLVIEDESVTDPKVRSSRTIDVKGRALTCSGNLHDFDARVCLKKVNKLWRIDETKDTWVLGIGHWKRGFRWVRGNVLSNIAPVSDSSFSGERFDLLGLSGE